MPNMPHAKRPMPTTGLAPGLLMRKDAGVAAVWIEGVTPRGEGDVRQTLRAPETDLFR